jgi:hypothetical protein
MAKQTEEQKLMHQWWMRFLLAAVFLGLSYAFFYLATDTGSLWEYALCVLFCCGRSSTSSAACAWPPAAPVRSHGAIKVEQDD